MLLTLTTTHHPATDLGYLLYKNPARVQSFPLAFGQAHVFYPDVSAERCTAVLLLDIDPVVSVLKQHEAQRVIDLGCGEGQLLQMLLPATSFTALAGMDVSYRALEIAQERLHLSRLPEKQRERITLFQGSLMYRDQRLGGYDAAAVIEVIEHLDAPRLAAFERVLFEFARPRLVVLTTPTEVEQLQQKFSLLPDSPQIFSHWLQLVTTHDIKGKNVHDTRLVVAMKAHHITHLLTFNTDDFRRFPNITIIHPTEVA